MFILASSSPRRRLLMQQVVSHFRVIDPGIDEGDIKARDSALPQEISKIKAYQVFKDHPEDTVFACDTIVYFKGHKLGKPKNHDDAKQMLTLLSGQTHKVISGYTLINKHIEVNKTVVTKVTFNQLSDKIIDDYVASGLPLDKAGAYGIQDEQYRLVDKIEGSYANVMGLPVEDIKKLLQKLGM
ncbi:MAG TPA: Maf family protein [Bacilli bacterium]|nr:Maf family protein [Bacilli bacterium]